MKAIVLLLPQAVRPEFNMRDIFPENLGFCNNEALDFISVHDWTLNLFDNNCPTSFGIESPRVYVKDLKKKNPFFNKDGNFELWILEKISFSERLKFYELASLVQDHFYNFEITEPELIKRLVDKNWDVRDGLDFLHQRHQMIEKYNLNDISEESIAKDLKRKVFRQFGVDKEGRPVSWVIMRKFKPSKHTLESIPRYWFYSIESNLRTRTNPYTDTELTVTDCGNLGFSNFSLDYFTLFASFATTLYPQRNFKFVYINTNSFFSAAWEVVKYMCPADVRDNTFVFSDDSYIPLLRSLIDEENIPQNYGGSGIKL